MRCYHITNLNSLIKPISRAFLTSSDNTSFTNMNYIGAKGSPCIRSFSMENSFEGLLFMSTDILIVDMIEIYPRPPLWIEPTYLQHCQYWSYNTMSKAFSRSILSITPLHNFSCMVCTISPVSRMQSDMWHPFMKANCYLDISICSVMLSLLDNILSSSFIVQFIKLIGR